MKTYNTTVNNTATTYTYTYDSRGNITAISVNGAQKYRYVYDNLGQLIREDNIPKSKTYVYNYDTSGNILSKYAYNLTAANATPSGSAAIYNYTYGNAWGDLLTNYNGNTITYDAIGNPLRYHDERNFTWEGRNLLSATYWNKSLSFTYNDEGIRTSKTVNGVKTNYYLSGSQIIAEETNKNVTYYLYDSTGIIGFQYHASTYGANTWDTYFYEKNLQGDIVAIYNSNGTILLSYTYDAWGNFTTESHNNPPTVVTNNPFRYRGYYYDRDIGLYYLNARYYDSQTGRFINADSLMAGANGGLQGYNLYVYCFNNPIAFVDVNGNWPEWLKDAEEWITNNIVTPVVDTIEKKISEVDFTYSSGLNVSLTFNNVTVSAQVAISVDSKGNIAIQASTGKGVSSSSFGFSVTTSQTITNAPTVYNLEDEGYQTGSSVGIPIKGVPFVFGGDFNLIPNGDINNYYRGVTVNAGLGTPGQEIHVIKTKTATYKSFNIFEFIRSTY